MTDTLRFCEADHSYHLGAERIPGVSEVLTLGGHDPALERIDPAVLTLASERGTFGHLACEYDDRGELDFDGLDPQLVPYVLAWRKFREHEDFTPDAIEAQVWSPRLRVAGTLDRAGLRRGRQTLVDIKTGTVIKRVMGLQLAGYVLLGVDAGLLAERADRLIVQLKPDGKYKLYGDKGEFSDDDFAAFEAAATTAHWKLRHGGALPAATEAA